MRQRFGRGCRRVAPVAIDELGPVALNYSRGRDTIDELVDNVAGFRLIGILT